MSYDFGRTPTCRWQLAFRRGGGLSLAIIVRVSYVECVRLRGQRTAKLFFVRANFRRIHRARCAIILITRL